MDGSKHVAKRKTVLLWQRHPVCCVCRTVDHGQIEVCLAVDDVVIHRERFAQSEDAARFAVDKMHAYTCDSVAELASSERSEM